MPVITLTHPNKGKVEIREDGSTFWQTPGHFGYGEPAWTNQKRMVEMLMKLGYAKPTVICLGPGGA